MHVIVQPFYFMQQKHFEDAFTALIPQHFDTAFHLVIIKLQKLEASSAFTIYYTGNGFIKFINSLIFNIQMLTE